MTNRVCKHCEYWVGFGCYLNSEVAIKATNRFDTCDEWKERSKDPLLEQVLISNPNELQWIEGDLPNATKVPRGACALVVLVDDMDGEFKRIETVYPWGDERNPIKWSDGTLPIGYHEKVKHYAWITKPKHIEGQSPKE